MVTTRDHPALTNQILVENREFFILTCIRRRRYFLSRVSTVTRDIDIAILSVCLSV